MEPGLNDILSKGLRLRPNGDAIGIADGSIILSFSRLQETVESFAQHLHAAGIRPGDLVTLVMPSSVEFVIAFMALTWVRAIAAPMNPDYKEAEFEFLIGDQGAVAVIDIPGDGANLNARRAAERLNLPVWEAVWEDTRQGLSLGGVQPVGEPVQASLVAPEGDDVALFLHTSGTTSKPKGVPLTHQNVMTSVRNIIRTYELCETDRSILVMPLFHVHGLMAGLLAPLAAGGSVYLTSTGRFSASDFWNEMLRWDANWYTAVPTIHQILVGRYDKDYPKDRPPRLRFIRSCSSPLAQSVLDDMEEKFHAPVLEAYAMTEAAHQMTSNPLPKNGPHKPGSVGRGQNVRVAIFDDQMTALAPRQIGEICVQGDNITSGYRNNPKANEEAFSGGWFHTGDQGYLDDEGYLFITGRIKELINRGGEKISPSKIDEALLAHPAVAEAISFGVPDLKYGEEVNAAIVLKPGATATSEELTEFCLKRLAAFQVPKRYFFANSLPKTGSGKIQRKQVSEQFIAREPTAS